MEIFIGFNNISSRSLPYITFNILGIVEKSLYIYINKYIIISSYLYLSYILDKRSFQTYYASCFSVVFLFVAFLH